MFHTLQGCRAAAALMVVLFHLGGTFAQAKYFGSDPMAGLFGWGDAGVDFFFVLSGFLIASVHRGDIGHPERLRRYVRKRAVRIYPSYWIVCAGVCAAAGIAPSLRPALPSDPATYIGALALVPLDPDLVGGTGSPILFVAWSLQYELLFYAVMGAFIVARPLGIVAVLAVLAAHFHCALAGSCGFPASFVASNLIFLFAFGVAAAYTVESRFRMPAPRSVAALAALAFVGFGAWVVYVGHDTPAFDRRLVFGALAALLVVALVQAESRKLIAMRQRWIGLLGDSSYALYLLHIPVISVLVKVIAQLHPTGWLALTAVYAAVLGACLVTAVLFYRCIERPLLERLGRRAAPGPKPRPVYAR